MLNVVLIEPKIAPNTGNIMRLCAAFKCRLHLVHPLGFRLTDKDLERAGMDYIQQVEKVEWDSVEQFLEKNADAPLYFFSTKGIKKYYELEYSDESFLIFGSETNGLPAHLYDEYKDKLYTIPMRGEARSLNLASSVAIVLGECMRQKDYDF
ncbi:tRNA (cytidine(34)-2'-O)-methyltransferase [Candidatus Margulisiibacteriota bacterium]